MNAQAQSQWAQRQERKWRYAITRRMWRVSIYAVAIIIAFLSLMPFVWTVSTSFKDNQQIMTLPPKLIPTKFVWQNFELVVTGMKGALPFTRWLLNSIFLSAANISGGILFAAIAGFGFARFRFPGRNLMFLAMLGSAIIPGMVLMLPQYTMFVKWHWTNTYLPLIIPNWFGGVFMTFLFRQYFVTIPRALDEAALVDGASHLDIFSKIILPLSKPMISTAMILTFMFNWNNFLGPFIFVHEMEKFPLAVGLRYMQLAVFSIGGPKEPLLAAYSLVMAAPVILAFFVFQRHFVQGIQLSASKE
jgi:multiple sugar transport system permease protein